jgi:hypothetical protein
MFLRIQFCIHQRVQLFDFLKNVKIVAAYSTNNTQKRPIRKLLALFFCVTGNNIAITAYLLVGGKALLWGGGGLVGPTHPKTVVL